jgi:hypothetical protein
MLLQIRFSFWIRARVGAAPGKSGALFGAPIRALLQETGLTPVFLELTIRGCTTLAAPTTTATTHIYAREFHAAAKSVKIHVVVQAAEMYHPPNVAVLLITLIGCAISFLIHWWDRWACNVDVNSEILKDM